MTAPVSLFAGLAQPAARAAMGDAVGAGLTGFDALLAMLTQALDGTQEGATSEQDAATSDAEETAGDPSLAGWLARVPENAVLAQTLGAEADAEESPETCAVSVKSIVDGLLGEDEATQAPATTGQAAAETPWRGATSATFAARTQADADAALARLREAVPTETLPAAIADQIETAATPTPVATAQAAAPEAARQAAAAAAPTDPRPTDARKGAAASAAAELKTERQDAGLEAVQPVETAAAAEASETATEAPPPEVPPTEVEVAAPARQAERPETITQALIGRLDALSANAAAVAAQVRGAPETVAKLAAGILDRLEGKTTRFDMQLDPHGLGKVDVSVEIASDGRLTAQLGFDSALGLSELRGRAQELRQALEQAGFSLAENSLSFDFTGQQRRQTPEGESQPSTASGQAFARALGLEAEADAAPIRYQARRGLDLLV